MSTIRDLNEEPTETGRGTHADARHELPMQAQLAALRSQLAHLLSVRTTIRWASAACVMLTAMLWLLGAAFVIDWLLNLSASFQWIMLPCWVVAIVIVFKKSAWPLLAVRESTEQIALVVERQHKIDSDIVAAIQFESPRAIDWGSPQLTKTIVQDVATFSSSLNVFDGFSYAPLPQLAMLLLFSILIAAGLVAARPSHAIAFGTRFLMGTASYPTKTIIQSIVINGNPVSPSRGSEAVRVHIPHGTLVAVEVRCGGELPATGFAQLSSLQGQSTNRVDLLPQSTDRTTFTGELTRIVESFRLAFHVGDATSHPIEVVVVPLPLVEIEWKVTPPNYAAALLNSTETDRVSHQFSVLEGSKATLSVVCLNKRLKSARITIGESNFELLSSTVSEQQPTWVLPANTPLDEIHDAMKYELQVIDEDGLSLARAIVGQIRLKPDRPPRITATAVTQEVLPGAEPKIDYTATDDFGLRKIAARIEVIREDGHGSQHEMAVDSIVDVDAPPAFARGKFSIALTPYGLAKGDQVKVVLEATDWRGQIPGQTSSSEPVSFHVTDINGVLMQSIEEDKKSAKQLDEILKRELSVGGDKK